MLAERSGASRLLGLVEHDRGLLLLDDRDPLAAAAAFQRALDLDAPVSRPRTRLLRAEALVAAGELDGASAELRAVALEPVGPGDFPDTLVARMARVEGLLALAAGDAGLGRIQLEEAAALWRHRLGGRGGETAGAVYMAALVDLGRAAISTLVEPERELRRVEDELAALDRVAEGADARVH